MIMGLKGCCMSRTSGMFGNGTEVLLWGGAGRVGVRGGLKGCYENGTEGLLREWD
jgi:hypothetical protein